MTSRLVGFDPDQAEAASDALIEQSEATTDRADRNAWQRHADRFVATDDPEDRE